MPTKLSEEQFWSMLRKNCGIYFKTAKAIREKYKIKYSRQAVRDRALSKPDLLKDIREQNIDKAEDVLHCLMTSDDENVQYSLVSDILDLLGLYGIIGLTEQFAGFFERFFVLKVLSILEEILSAYMTRILRSANSDEKKRCDCD